jgi:hypothetical protein
MSSVPQRDIIHKLYANFDRLISNATEFDKHLIFDYICGKQMLHGDIFINLWGWKYFLNVSKL